MLSKFLVGRGGCFFFVIAGVLSIFVWNVFFGGCLVDGNKIFMGLVGGFIGC